MTDASLLATSKSGTLWKTRGQVLFGGRLVSSLEAVRCHGILFTTFCWDVNPVPHELPDDLEAGLPEEDEGQMAQTWPGLSHPEA